MNGSSIQQICIDLKRSSLLLEDVCLHSSSKWAIELLADIQEFLGDTGNGLKMEFSLPTDDFDIQFLLGREYFDSNEFDQAAEAFKKSKSRYGRFLRFYSEYLAIEKNVAGECLLPTKMKPKDPSTLAVLEVEVGQSLVEEKNNPFLLYIYSLILIDRGRRGEARQQILRSLHIFPVHWGAWLTLWKTLEGNDEENQQKLPAFDHWMSRFYSAYAYNSVYKTTEALVEMDFIDRALPNTRFVLGLRANTLNRARRYGEAKELYETLMKRDPHRLEDLDTYSNILYHEENAKEKLNVLATKAAHTNSLSPVTCCIIGTYYSSKKEHAEAVQYFEQALRIDRYYSSAWTLMGHELYELGKFEEAANCYERATQQNPMDSIAWYGLAQTHETAGRSAFALHYYEKAAVLRGNDDRCWTALGQQYAHPNIKKTDLAIQYFEKAICLGDVDGSAVKSLAELYEESQDNAKASEMYGRYIERFQNSSKKNIDFYGKALIFMVKYSAQIQDWHCARYYLNLLRCCGDVFATEIEELTQEYGEL